MMIGIGMNMVQARGGGIKPFTPNSLGGLAIWLDAESGAYDSLGQPVTADGQAVATWRDRSGSGAHAEQAVLAKQPIYRTGANGKNGKPALEFSAASATSLVTSNVTVGAMTVFTVTVPSTATNTYMYSLGGTSGGMTLYRNTDRSGGVYSIASVQSRVGVFGILFREWPPTTGLIYPENGWYLFCHKTDGTPTENAANSVGMLFAGMGKFVARTQSQNTTPGSAPMAVKLTLGSDGSGNNSMTGKFAEVLVYNRMLSLTEQRQVEAYLAAKYNFTLLAT